MYDCLVCKKKHEMPQDGLPNNEIVLEILEIEIIQVSRGEAHDSLKILLNEIQKKRSIIKLGIDNSTDLVKEHCINLRSDVQLKTEEAIQQINDINSKLIEEIDEYEQELIEFNKNNSKSLETFNSIVKELESFHTLNTEYLNQYQVDDEVVKKSNKEAIYLIKKAELEIENLNNMILNGDILKFVQLTAEEVILQVSDFSTKIIEEIDEYEKELVEFDETNPESLEDFNTIVKELESFYTLNTE